MENEAPTNEVWKIIPLPKFKNRYEVSNLGRVRHVKHKRILAPWVNGSGYVQIRVSDYAGGMMHRLVAEAFIPKPEEAGNLQVNHIDGNKSNNNANNLEWVTPSQNVRHAISIGHRPKGERMHPYKITKGEESRTLRSALAVSKFIGCNLNSVIRASKKLPGHKTVKGWTIEPLEY